MAERRGETVVTSPQARTLTVASPEDVKSLLAGAPAVFLSAGVPYRRPTPQNEKYMDAVVPEEKIRSAVVLLTRAVLRKKWRLVFGAQPAIGAMVLSIGRDVVPEDERGEPRILIFQSSFFEGQLPGSTLDLAGWETGRLVFTPAVPAREGLNELQRRDESLKQMRELMVSVPNLCAGVFIGGMEGVEEEAALFRLHNPGKPMFPLVSTGSAARLLYEKERKAYVVFDDVTSTPKEPVSYSLVAHDILEHIAPDSRPAAEEKTVADALTPNSPAVTAHLTMLQGIITRLANNSASCKTWCFTLVAALVTLSGWAGKLQVLPVVIVPLVIFGFLDASYLAAEKSYRHLFNSMVDKLRAGEYELTDTFDADATPFPVSRWDAFWSWAVAPVYVTLIALALIAAVVFGVQALMAPAAATTVPG